MRDSLKIPKSYFDSNFQGFINLIGLSEKYSVHKFIFASSSSVYGDQKKFPLSENNKILGMMPHPERYTDLVKRDIIMKKILGLILK